MTDNIIKKMTALSQEGYCCSQILFILALESRGGANPDLTRSMAGLCHGLGYSGEICGALTGASCLIAFFAGKGSDEEQEDDRFVPMVLDLVEWFEGYTGGRYNGIKCEDILEVSEMRKPDLRVCANIIADTYTVVVTILEENGYSV